jgi:3-oxoacyl-[acyl-carrier-protein] synthase-3
MKAFIKAINYYLPETILSNEELVKEFPEWSVDKIADKVGINERHVAGKEETSADMAVKAAEKLFRDNAVEKASIDFILFCTQSPDYFLPTSACLIQERLGLSTSCGALDFNLGCSGYIYGLSLAKGLIAGGIAQNILLLTGETYSKFLHAKDKGNRTIFGDAASATLVSTEGFAEIGNFSLGTDGKGANNLIVKSGASRQRERVNDLSFDENGNPISSDHLHMNGSEIFNFTIKAVPPLIKDTLEKNDLSFEKVDYFIFHQANKFMVNYLRKKIKIEKEKFLEYMSEVGNTVSSTIPIVLTELLKTKDIKGNVLLAGFGVGYSWGGTVIKVLL